MVPHHVHRFYSAGRCFKCHLVWTEWMCAKFNVEASCEEKGTGLLLQWGWNSWGSKAALVPLDVTEVSANTVVFCAASSPGHISCTWCCIHHISCSYPSLFPCSLSSCSRPIMEKKAPVSLVYRLAYIQLSCICLSSLHPRFCSQFCLIGTGWMHFTFILLACFVWSCTFLTFPTPVILTRAIELQPLVSQEKILSSVFCCWSWVNFYHGST